MAGGRTFCRHLAADSAGELFSGVYWRMNRFEASIRMTGM
jgi:hypothetical protein